MNDSLCSCGSDAHTIAVIEYNEQHIYLCWDCADEFDPKENFHWLDGE